MFLRVLLFFIITILNTYLSISQELTQKISGKVIDATSKQPLIGATITIPNTKPLLGVITNINGEFELNNVPIGRQDIKVSFIGYQPIITRGALITSARAYTIIVEMEESLENLNEVLITPINAKRPLNKSAKVSARSFSIEEATRFAGGLGDPARVAYNFAGATFGSAQDNGVVIRGNSPTNVL
ncbi:carboxypeptidase-like regulatory domain-containing protein [Tenacibaculum halocynthiae]